MCLGVETFCHGELRLENDTDGHFASPNFLRNAALIKQQGKGEQIETLVPHFLMVSTKKIDRQTEVVTGLAFSSKHFQLEQLALWDVGCCKQTVAFGVLLCHFQHSLQFRWNLCSLVSPPWTLGSVHGKKHNILTMLDEMQLGTNTPIGEAIFEHLNKFKINSKSQERVEMFCGKLELEHASPKKHKAKCDWTNQWDNKTASMWMHRLGKLALPNQSTNHGISNGSFDNKRKGSLCLLTQCIAKHPKWTRHSVEANHQHLLDLVKKHWRLQIGGTVGLSDSLLLRFGAKVVALQQPMHVQSSGGKSFLPVY